MSSKLRKLKQQAYEAGRRRDWAAAAEVYAQILEMDKNNPALQNEYGDACLKMGDTPKAIRQFLSAASRYRQNGLLNNAQAVYKKVLRHEPGNLNANWYLAEIRSAQGLLAEGARHALVFLAAAEQVSGEIKDIFLKRCIELFTLYPQNDQILERVEGIFRIWKMPLEAARAGCLRACLLHRGGKQDDAAKAVAALAAALPEITNYAEYTRWLEEIGQKKRSSVFGDVNTIDLDAAPADSSDTVPLDGHEATKDVPQSGLPHEVLPAAAPERNDAPKDEPAAEVPDMAATASAPEVPDMAAAASAPEADIERDEDGCINIAADGETCFADLMDEVESGLGARTTADDDGSGDWSGAPNADKTRTAAAHEAASTLTSGSVNLLEEILAEEGEDIVRSSETEQVSTIASEIGRNFSESGEIDPEILYQQGMVYLEMGLYDQAVVAFSGAARDTAYRLRAAEMWGVALRRAGQAETALAVLQDALAVSGDSDRESLGLRYHAGRILEDLGRVEEAQAHYRQIHACDAGFADVIRRLRVTVGMDSKG